MNFRCFCLCLPPLSTSLIICLAVIDKSLGKLRECFEGLTSDVPSPFEFGGGGAGQMTVSPDDEEVSGQGRVPKCTYPLDGLYAQGLHGF